MLPKWTRMQQLPGIGCTWQYWSGIRALYLLFITLTIHILPVNIFFKKFLKALVESLCENWCLKKDIASSSVPTTIVMAWKIVQAQLVKHLLIFISHLPRTFLAGLLSHLQLWHKLRADLIITSLCSRCKNKHQP